MKTLVVIPTRNRFEELFSTLNTLEKNNFFFSKIIIVDSSDYLNKRKIKQNLKNYQSKIDMIDSVPSTCIQRNLGFDYLTDEKFIMFLDDDNVYYEDTFIEINKFLKNKEYDFVGVALNQILDLKNNFAEKIKTNKLLDYFNIYPQKKGGFSKSGWQSKFLNFETNQIVEWLPTRAVIYKSEFAKNERFDTNLGVYGYLEDLDYSLRLKKYGNLMVCSKAMYTHDQTVDRSGFEFGKKEVHNRYYIVKKHQLSKKKFFLTLFFKILINFKDGLFGNLNSFKRLLGNITSLAKLRN